MISMTISLQASRSLVSPHSSVRVQFVMALMSSSHCARGLPLFLAPPPIPNIIDFSKLFALRMMCPKYDSCCFFISASSGLVVLISSKLSILLLSAFLIVQDSQPYSTTVKTNAFTILHFVVIVISLSFHILLSPVIAALPNANRLKMSPLHEHESSILAPRKTKSRTISTFSPSN